MAFIPDSQKPTKGFVADTKPVTKKVYIPQLPETGVLAPKPIGTPSKKLSEVKSLQDLAGYGFTKLTGVRPIDVGREALNILGTGEMILGTAIGGAVVPYTKSFQELEESRKKTQEMNDKLIQTIKIQQEAGKDVKRLKQVLVNNLNDQGATDEEINQALQLTSKQIVGAGLQTTLDVATAGTYKPADAVTGKLLQPAEQILTKQVAPTLLGQFKVGLKSAGIGGAVGYGFDVSNELQQDETDLTPGFATLLGVGLPLAGKVGEYFGKEQKALRAEGQINEIVEKYRQAINPLKSDIKKIEIKGGRNLDNTLRFMAEEEVVPKKDNLGRLDTVEESKKLQEKKSTVDTLLAENLDNTQRINDLEQVRKQAKQEIAKYEPNAEILKKKYEDIDDLINAEIERYGTNMLTDKELHAVKNGMWSVGFDMNRTTKSPSAKKLGNIMKQIIEDNNADNFNIREINRLSGEYRSAIDLLDNIHGNTVSGGKMGGFFYRMLVGYGLERVLGNIPGLRGVSFFLGQFIGRHYNEFINDPERIVNSALKQADKIKMDVRSRKILDLFKKGLQEKNKTKLDLLMLPEPVMRLPEKSPSTIQKEIESSGMLPQPKIPYAEKVAKSEQLQIPEKSKGKTADLIQEAKKYKSVEEFVRAQPNKISGEFYRYETTGTENNKVKFFSDKMDYVDEYKYVREQNGKTGKIIKEKIDLKNPLVIEAKSNQFSDPSFEKQFIDKALREGNDGVVFKNPEGDVFIVKLPKSQLTDIWNKANKK